MNLERFDVFSRTESEYRVQTKTGATISIISLLVMLVLFLSETYIFMSKEIRPELSVDTSLLDKIEIHMDITFPALPCAGEVCYQDNRTQTI